MLFSETIALFSDSTTLVNSFSLVFSSGVEIVSLTFLSRFSLIIPFDVFLAIASGVLLFVAIVLFEVKVVSLVEKIK